MQMGEGSGYCVICIRLQLFIYGRVIVKEQEHRH